MGEFRGTSAHFSTHFQTSETVHYAFLYLLRLSHDLQTFLNVLMHADLFSGMYTSQGSGGILVRMYGSWENFVVHLRTFRRIFKQVKQCIMPLYAFCASHTTCRLFRCSNADLFSGMYTSQGSGDILVRMCGSWENFVVHLRTFRRIFKQVKQCIMPFYAFCASYTTCRLF